MHSSELTAIRATTMQRFKQPLDKPVKNEKLLCEAGNLISKFTNKLSGSEIHRLAGVCVYMWTKTIETPYYLKVKGRYRFLAHTVAFLYNAVEGIEVNSKWILEREGCLQGKLPPTKQLLKYGIKPRVYTKACRYLHEMCRELAL